MPDLFHGGAGGALIVSTQELADLCQVTPRTVTNWKNKHGLPAVPKQRGRFDLGSVVPWLIKFCEAKGMDQAGVDADTKRRHQDATARRAEAQARALEGSVVDVSAAAEVVVRLVGELVAGVDSLESRLSYQLIGVTESEAEAVISREVSAIREQLAAQVNDLASFAAEGADSNGYRGSLDASGRVRHESA